MRYRALSSIASLVVLAAAATSTGARADEAQDGFTKRLFAGDVVKGKKAYACFTRRYDSVHLAQHPAQKVSAMKLLITAETEPENQTLTYAFRLGFNFRNRPGNFDSSGDCHHPEATEVTADKLDLGCGVDCDGGGISVELTHGDSATLVRLESIRIWKDHKSEPERTALTGGQDDREFRLDRASLEDCRALITDRKELAALRRK